jgi:chromosome segregation ATPase
MPPERPEVGIARLETSIGHLLEQVERLCEDERSNHDAINDLENGLRTVQADLKRLQEDVTGQHAAWKARAGWVAVTIAGIGSGLLGDWMKRLLGLGGP